MTHENYFPMHKTLWNVLFFFLMGVPVSGQEILNTSNNWYFGDRAGLDFNTSPPTVLTDGQLDTQEGVATISDDNGALLFYTDGITVWDRTHQPMPGANGTLNGHFSSTQSSIIIPNLGNSNLYYIFTTDELGASDGLSFTTIDISLPGNGGAGAPLGDVASGTLNIQLATPVTEKLTGVLKPDCTGYWVIAHGWNNNRFLVYEVASDGVDPVPVITDIGNIHSGGLNNNNAVGYMKVSTDGQKLALVNRANGTIDVYDFNNVNGAVSNEVEIVPNDPLTYGIEFSPGGNYLYIGGEFLVSRYEFGSGTLTDVPIDDPFAWGGSEVVRALQLGPDENIYISVRYSEYLSAIYDPDGMNPTISAYAIFLDPDNTGRNCRFGLPNIFYRDFSPVEGDSLTLTTCPGEDVFYNGSFFPAGSVNEISLMSTNGCDSVVVLTVEPFVVSNEIIEANACEGNFYDFYGTLIEAGTQQSFTYQDMNGCDSVITVHVSISEVMEQDLFVEACQGGVFVLEGVEIEAGTSSQVAIVDDEGCNFLINVFVEALPVDQTDLSFVNCGDTTFTFLGTGIEVGSMATFTLQNQYGCDSLVTVQVYDSYEETHLDISLCPEENYHFNDVELHAGTDTTFFLQDVNGCDSIVNLTITGSPELNYSLDVQSSCWNMNTGNISVQNISGGVPPYEFSPDGQQFFSQSVFENLAPGEYQFYVRDANQCLFEQTVEIPEIEEIQVEITHTSLPCEADSILVTAELINGTLSSITWDWSNGSGQNQTYIFEPGIYTLEISNLCQTLEETITVSGEETELERLFYIPNVFSPNDDGANDLFQVFPKKDLEVLDFEIHIFNRWGDFIFESYDLDNCWDGNFLEKPIDTGVYVWWIEATVISCHEAVRIFEKGDVTIIR